MAGEWTHRFALFLSGWLLLGAGTALTLGMTDPLLHFVITYVGFVLAVEYSEPPTERPVWHRRLRWVTLLGLLAFGFTVADWVERVTGAPLL